MAGEEVNGLTLLVALDADNIEAGAQALRDYTDHELFGGTNARIVGVIDHREDSHDR